MRTWTCRALRPPAAPLTCDVTSVMLMGTGNGVLLLDRTRWLHQLRPEPVVATARHLPDGHRCQQFAPARPALMCSSMWTCPALRLLAVP